MIMRRGSLIVAWEDAVAAYCT